MEKKEYARKRSYERFTKLLESGDTTPKGIIDSYSEMQGDISYTLIGACQAIADYTRKEEK